MANSYLEINCDNIKNNVEKIVKEYNEYSYFFGVVKASSYGLNHKEAIKATIEGGCNYLAVANFEEALNIRKCFVDIPILCLGVVEIKDLRKCIEKNITVTTISFEYVEEIIKLDICGLKVHIKVNTGMNRLGMYEISDIKEAIDKLRKSGVIIEGIYTHMYNAKNDEDSNKQISRFDEVIKQIDTSDIKIIHMFASVSLVTYKKQKYVNGIRFGLIIYGFTEDNKLELESCVKLYSNVIKINNLEAGENLGYNGDFKAAKKTKIAVIPIGYADGVIRQNTGRKVYIKEKEYKIVGNICMDMLFIEIDDNVSVGDKVYILKNNDHIISSAKYLKTVPYEILCLIGNRSKRIIKKINM